MANLQKDTPSLAEQYDDVSDLQFEHGKLLLQGLALQSGDHLLDVGAGTGRLAALAASDYVGASGQVIGIDPLPLRINIAQERAKHLELANLRFEIGRAEHLIGFDDARFDAVILNNVYHWLPHKDQVLSEAWRVLKVGGRIGISSAALEQPHDIQRLLRETVNELNLGRGEHVGSTPYRVTHAQLAAQFESAGFLIQEIRLRRFADVFPNAQAVLDFSQASSFGNFLIEYVPAVREQIIERLTERLNALQTPSGIHLNRYLHFAIAEKTARPSLGQR